MTSTTAHEPLFFIHIMKTAGSTLRRHIRQRFEDEQLYPSRSLDSDLHEANSSVPYLLSRPPERYTQTRAYMGHFPYLVVEALNTPLLTMTVLRDPVDRVVSHLGHLRRYSPAHKDWRYEELYDDPYLGLSLLRNHQVKIFALTEADHPASYRHELVIDDARLELAKANLDAVALVGLVERFDEFLAVVESRLGWKLDRSMRRRVGGVHDHVPGSLLKRIAADHEPERELYDHASRRL
jgi:Sulfotransferase family